MNYVGIDHHRQYSHLTVMDQEGQVLRSGRVANVRVEIEKFLEGLEGVELGNYLIGRRRLHCLIGQGAET